MITTLPSRRKAGDAGGFNPPAPPQGQLTVQKHNERSQTGVLGIFDWLQFAANIAIEGLAFGVQIEIKLTLLGNVLHA